MMSALKDALKATPKQAFSVFIGFWVFSALMIYLPVELEYMVIVGQPFLVLGGVGYLIPALKGIPDWRDAKKNEYAQRECIKGLNVAAKDFLWAILVKNRRSTEAKEGNEELWDHYIVAPQSGGGYQITKVYWPLLRKDGMKLLYQGKHEPSNKEGFE